MRYRLFAAGGSGRFSGNIGGRYFTYENTNYTYSVGGQVSANLIGFTSRWDSPFLMTPSATAVAVRIGGKYDRRAQERYPAFNAGISARHGRFVVMLEDYYKRELNFGSVQNAYNVTLGALVLKNKLMAAADFGQFLATDFTNPPDQLQTDLKKIRDETQWRARNTTSIRINLDATSLRNAESARWLCRGLGRTRPTALRSTAQGTSKGHGSGCLQQGCAWTWFWFD